MSAEPTPDRDVQRALRSAQLAYERVEAEALRYRNERDKARETASALRQRLQERNAMLAQAKRKRDSLKVRVAELEGSRGIRLERRLRKLRRRLAKPAAPAPARKQPAAPSVPVRAAAEVTTFAATLAVDPAGLAERTAAAERAAARLRERADGRRLRVAAIADDFTRLCLEPDCDLLNISASGWHEELEGFDPDLVFIESAWRGKDGSWRDKVSPVSDELRSVIDWARAAGVATVFWNKEDPVHFERYVEVAAAVDHAFTSDLDMLTEYQLRLGHQRVGFLPFAAQPRQHNPLEITERRDALMFAGSYYAQYPERMVDLRATVTGAIAAMPVEIYDRNYGTTYPELQFPEEYRSHVVGTLGPEEMDLAYKGYRYSLNINTVKRSQTMFARRVYELLASNTVTISNWSRAIGIFFADLVPMSDSAEEIEKILSRMVADPDGTDRLRVLGVRKVLGEHTYAHRLAYVVASVTGRTVEESRSRVGVLVATDDPATAVRQVAAARAQTGVEVEVRLVSAADEVRAWATGADVTVLDPAELADTSLAALFGTVDGVAVFHGDDWYGEHYLRDLVDAWTYSSAEVVGKDRRHRLEEGRLVETGASSYVEVGGLPLRRALVTVAAAERIRAAEALTGDAVPSGGAQLSLHRFDYCEGGAADLAEAAAASADLPIDQGIAVADVWAQAATVVADQALREATVVVPEALEPALPADPDERLRVSHHGSWTVIQSSLDEGEVAQVVGAARLDLTGDWASSWREGTARFAQRSGGDLDVVLVLRFQDEDGTTLGEVRADANAVNEVPVPADARWAEVAWEVSGPGRQRLSPVILAAWPFGTPVVLGA
ncbi:MULTISPECIES: glycosyltransferase family protein [unclassified Nocardioides]|uniref:CgeB family protein n=1 Tax=unclassified Nocardioides TaxID=2615069 RepID=UPI000703A666|nr:MULTISPECIES: glycosyltransferase [unclassified Nocardioides]KRC54015.1 hypothetical protein ASE19_08040 [Nocardioides sp. Root79]KRC71351.1 hypothetical protein ASE20_10455 [Nocardioides sp. Root240]